MCIISNGCSFCLIIILILIATCSLVVYFRYISVLPPINLQYKVDNLYNLDPVSHDNESISKYYQDFSKDLRRTSLNYAVELAGFVKILYLITGIFIIVTVYLIYQLLSARPRPPKFRKFKPNPKSIVLLTYPIFLDGHRKVIAFMLIFIMIC